MKPVFANSAFVGAPERVILRNGRWRRRMLQVRYGLFVHPKAGPTLIDTGYTQHSLNAAGRSAALRCYARMLRARLVAEEQIAPFLAHFNLTPLDISRVIMTHFHADHVSGLASFPNARFSASGAAWARVQHNSAFQNARHGVFSELVPKDFHARLDPIEQTTLCRLAHLPDGHDIFGDSSAMAVPLGGHADGHFGVLFNRLEVPLLYAADTQWVCEALSPDKRPRLLPRLISDSFKDVARSSDQVELFRNAGGTVLLCHDDTASAFDFAQGAKL